MPRNVGKGGTKSKLAPSRQKPKKKSALKEKRQRKREKRAAQA